MYPTVTVPVDEIISAVAGRNVGIVSNATFWLPEAGNDLAGVIGEAARNVVLLYGEHGFRADGGAGVAPAATGIHESYARRESRDLYSLFTDGTEPGAGLLTDLDQVVVGLPDVGCRHYSYKTVMCVVMQSAAASGKPVVVVDFPNPVGGRVVEGNLPDPAYIHHFQDVVRATRGWEYRPGYVWCAAPMVYRHGMTMGELALWARDSLELDLDLTVIRLDGWRRDMWWDQTGRPWIPTDPSIHTPDTALDFLCTGLFQGTSVAWGIGTGEPFRVLGAPWIEDNRLLEAIRAKDLPGVEWSRAFFIPRWRDEAEGGPPTWGKYAGRECNGIRLHVTDRAAVQTAEVQLSLFEEFLRLYPEQFTFADEARFDCRLEDLQWTRRLQQGEGVRTILPEWREMSRQYERMRSEYLLY